MVNLNQLLAKCKSLNHVKQLQVFIITLGYTQNQLYAFKLVRFCLVTLDNLPYGRLIFDCLSSPNVYLFAAMITGYASQSHHHSAFLLYRSMLRQGSARPNQFIYPHVLKSCPEVFESHGTALVHTHIMKSGFGQYPVVQTALVDSYSRFRSDVGSARQVFDEMSEKNVVSWTAMISGYTRVGDIGSAILLFEKMPERDVPAWNAVIAGCTQNGEFSEAIYLFKRMLVLAHGGQNLENRPNQVTAVCVLSACSHTGMLQLGKWIHSYIYKNALGPDSFVSNALVDMYGKCGSLKVARRVFDRTSQKSLTSWNSMINSYALHGQSNDAIGVFEEMIRCGADVRPDEVTFVGLFNACTHGGLVEQGISYFDLMTRGHGIEPQIEHYGCLIDLLGRAGRFEEAMEVVRGMRIEPDEVVWGSLLNGCKIYGRTDLAEFAVKNLIQIDPNNGGYGIMLANIYGQLGKWDDARKVRKVLRERNAYKTPGCSWIEVDNQVYQFYSVDKSHPRTEEIYQILDTLVGFIILKLSCN
ncbi:unnamed protein product [Prunus armeniaca]|uniref:Pentatricopeptide repeat-containing protein At1g33350 n=1 Tax=Prunus mume TaxID=102107 RepID=A0ABM0P098_PRUMU|nr:PREDICTED: pentatricopeptide repeat-containing protein At1g33350 [Prunus mume]